MSDELYCTQCGGICSEDFSEEIQEEEKNSIHPKAKQREDYKWKMKYIKAMKTNKELRKEITQVNRKFKKIHEISGS